MSNVTLDDQEVTLVLEITEYFMHDCEESGATEEHEKTRHQYIACAFLRGRLLDLAPAEVLENLKFTVPIKCTGTTATWCPVHGNCTCSEGNMYNDLSCPLHSTETEHGANVQS